MWSLAVSLALLVRIGLPLQVQQQALPSPEVNIWDKVSQSLALIERDGKPVGYAVLIDPSGLFLAHSSYVRDGIMYARSRKGEAIALTAIASDEPTQLVLLKAQLWSPTGISCITVASQKDLKGHSLIAALPSGAITGTFVSGDRKGVMKPSLRYVPLSEIRFETPNDKVGGAPVFTMDGKLVGILSATLEPATYRPAMTKAELAGGADPKAVSRSNLDQSSNYAGPAGMTVGYALNSNVLERVVDGFRSPDHKVLHPTIGAFFSDALGQGAIIQAILPDSPASKGDLRVGDVVFVADDQPVKDHFDLAAILFKQNVGKAVALQVRRGNQTIKLTITVGRQLD